MANKDYKAFIVEGEAREPLIIDNISKVFFSHENFKIITLPAGQNIYMLWKKMKKDDFDTDIIEVLRENHAALQGQLNGLQRNDFSEIYLFFDCDSHQDNLSSGDDANVLEQMLHSFDNETENGKLYISYPMVEALRDFAEDKCGDGEHCFVSVGELVNYKGMSEKRAKEKDFRKYGITIWKALIKVFAMKISCLMNQDNTIDYKQYTEEINPYEIYIMEKAQIQKQRVYVLSAFPEFLLDYFGIKLWNVCVKGSGRLQDCLFRKNDDSQIKEQNRKEP